MSVSLEKSVNRPLSEGHRGVSNTDVSKSPSRDSLEDSSKTDDPTTSDDSKNEQKSEPSTPTLHPMAFTIDFGQSKELDKSKLQELAKKSQARHQRIQSVSSSFTKPAAVPQKPPLSVKLPRKAQGYNSEGYFSSDQEDSTLSGSIKHRQSPLAQPFDRSYIPATRSLRSPVNDVLKPRRLSKSPIVDSIMSRSDILPSRQHLNLPLKSPNSSYFRDMNRTPSYGNIPASYQLKSTMADILDCSPEGMMLTDVSSPDFDALTPDQVPYPSEPKSPSYRTNRRAVSEMPDLVHNKNMLSKEQLYIDDDDIDNKSDNSSTGTYTIEDNNYTEEQKARMSIDRTFAGDNLNDFVDKRRSSSKEKDPELIFDYPEQKRQNLLECRLDASLRSPKKDITFAYPHKVTKDKNVLEISCCYESPTDNDLAMQTSKQIKSTRSYLEKIKSRVKTITEKTFSKSPPRVFENPDHGGVTSVTTSGILSAKFPPKSDRHLSRRRCSLAKSEIDQTDYVHRIARESSVPLHLPSNELKQFTSTPLKNAQKMVKKPDTPSEVVGQLSYLSLNRCKGDKTWIQEWADSVKKYNKDLVDEAEDSELNRTFTMEDEEELETQKRAKNSRSSYTNTGSPSKIPSPVGSIRMSRCTPDLIPSSQDTGSYLQKTQTAITNLQARLQPSKPNLHQFSPQNTTILIEKHTQTRLPVPQNFSPIPQLSRSNSLNYRLRRKVNSTDSSPLRSPGNYVVIGSTKLGETKKLLDTASKSLEHDPRKNLKSPLSDKDLSNSSDDKTLSYKPPLNQTPKRHSRHSSFDGRNPAQYFNTDLNNSTISLKNVLRNNAENYYSRIDPSTTVTNRNHSRIQSDGKLKNVYTPNNLTSIKRSSSFNTVTKYPYLDYRKQNDAIDFLSDDSDTEKTNDYKYENRKRIDSPELKSNTLKQTPRCPNTPEMKRKFGTGLARCSVRVTNKERALNCRLSEPPIAAEARNTPVKHQSRTISDTTRQNVFNRLTKSKSSTREPPPKLQEKVEKKPVQHRSSSALATKEIEFSNWKKRSSYDPMKAAQEGKKRQLAKRGGCNKDDNNSPSHLSPVHRSQSFHNTNMAELTLATGYGSDDSIDDDTSGLQLDPMVTSVMSDCVDVRRNSNYRDLGSYQNTQQASGRRHLDIDKRKTFILDEDHKLNIDQHTIDKRKTFILDSDTNSTTSPRNSSIFSQEKNSVTTCTSDTENDSGPETAPAVVLRHPTGVKRNSAPVKHRHSGDYSMSSSTTSISQPQKHKTAPIQPRYMDISKYKNEQQTNKNYLRRDASRTYVTVLQTVPKGSARLQQIEQKKQELEKWKRRASYDPRKAAAQGNPAKQSPHTASSVLRSQSFHGPMYVQQSTSRHQPMYVPESTSRHQPVYTPLQIADNYDVSSDNDF